MKTVNVIDKENRGVLIEGRSHGMGFAFCMQTGENEYITVQPISPCKDYLNDVVWSEHTDKFISVWGLKYKKKGIYIADQSFMIIRMLHSNKNATADVLKEMGKQLHNQIDNIKALLNHVEKQMGVPPTEISKVEGVPDSYLLTLSTKWCSSTAAISLYTLVTRLGLFYDGKDNPEQYLESYKNPLDAGLWHQALPRYKDFAKQGIVPSAVTFDEQPANCVHDFGICTFNIPSYLKNKK